MAISGTELHCIVPIAGTLCQIICDGKVSSLMVVVSVSEWWFLLSMNLICLPLRRSHAGGSWEMLLDKHICFAVEDLTLVPNENCG